MSDLESYLTHCYDMILQGDGNNTEIGIEEKCACAALIERQEQQHN